MWKAIWLSCVASTALALCPGMAGAGEVLEFGPPADWVKPMSVVRETTAPAGAPVALLGSDLQSRFGEGDDRYADTTFKILTAQGLPLGRLTLVWNPQTETVTVHKVHILRGDAVIDVLAQGQTFTTLRREANLNREMPDGNLTAVLQVEGLQVGDILTYAMTTHRKDPVLQGRSETLASYLVGDLPISRISYRAVWDTGTAMRWKAAADLPGVRVVRTATGSELIMELRDYKTPEVQERVPDRYRRSGLIELTEFASWQEMSGLMAPLYAGAATLKPESPLKAEAAAIRAAHKRPEDQAAAALRLVEEQVHYVYAGMGPGNLAPADADTTWTRRFGDAKAKTALLLGLLHELGIEAEAVMVSLQAGDGLNDSLPLIELFDHVVVRATIGDNTYWLDGTRLGDTRLEHLPVPGYRWGLPVRPDGKLIKITIPVPDKPLEEQHWTYDASAGINAPVRIKSEQILRGDAGLEIYTTLSAVSRAEFEESARTTWTRTDKDLTIESVDYNWDADAGELRMTLTGTTKLRWQDEYHKPLRFLADAAIGGGFDLDRKDGPGKEAPVGLEFPLYRRSVTTLVLPRKGKGFSITGEAVDKTLAGYAMKRSFSLTDGVFVVDSAEHTVTDEVPAAEVLAAEAELDRLRETAVYVQAPYDYEPTDADKVARAGEPGDAAAPATAADYVERARRNMYAGYREKAVADIEAALQLEPKSAAALSMRGAIRQNSEDKEGALADYAAALALDPRNVMALYGQGGMAWKDKDYDKAITCYTRLLDINPADTNARHARGILFMSKGDKARALDDALTNAAMQPDSAEAQRFLADVYQSSDQPDKALEILQTAVTQHPEDAELRLRLARNIRYRRCDTDKDCKQRTREALAEYDRAIALEPSSYLYVERAEARSYDDDAGKLADLDQALRLAPDNEYALKLRAKHHLAHKHYDMALADADALVERKPDNITALRLRASIQQKRGDGAGHVRDADAVLAHKPEDSIYLHEACQARAVHRLELEKALELCNAAVPADSTFLETRALVYLQMGRYDQAIADYDALLKDTPRLATALFGRGIARLRLGMTKAGRADLAEARDAESGVAQTFAEYGIEP